MSIRGGRSPRDRGDYPEDDAVSRVSPYVRTGRYGKGPGDQRRYGRYGNGSGVGGVLRFGIFLVILAAGVLVAMVTVARPLVRAVVVPWAQDSPSALRIGFVADLVREDLGSALTDPASTDSSRVVFTVNPNDTPATLAPRLEAAGVLASPRAFLFLAKLEDLTPKLTSGQFLIARNLTPEELSQALISSPVVVKTVPLTLREGLRLEQITAKLQTLDGTQIDPEAFYEEVTNPPDALLADFPWLLDPNIRPKGASLEGFLYPATYDLRIDDIAPTTADGLVRMMLKAFYDRVGPDLMAVPDARGLTFYQVLTLASIVDKEVVLAKEQALIAGVYQNRLSRIPAVPTGLLQADPTVIYGVDTVKLAAYSTGWASYVFWTVPATPLKDVHLPDALAGYNTYTKQGLPPGPIDTPTVASIEAALVPDTKSGYAFFVAIPKGGGAHDFSKTLAEHSRKLHLYGYQ
jgi:UPF0755 protein